MDLDDGDGVLVEPALLTPGRQDRALITEGSERVQRVLVLLLVASFDYLWAALRLRDAT
jgi:hypothetical protein